MSKKASFFEQKIKEAQPGFEKGEQMPVGQREWNPVGLSRSICCAVCSFACLSVASPSLSFPLPYPPSSIELFVLRKLSPLLFSLSPTVLHCALRMLRNT
jgi:hypothetical protein